MNPPAAGSSRAADGQARWALEHSPFAQLAFFERSAQLSCVDTPRLHLKALILSTATESTAWGVDHRAQLSRIS